jgi:hypothetical protein
MVSCSTYSTSIRVLEVFELNRLTAFLVRLAEEPPFRLISKIAIKRLPVSIRTKARWDVATRPQYLAGGTCGGR